MPTALDTKLKPTSVRPEVGSPYIVGRFSYAADPLGLSASQWRNVVSKAPVARTCIQTLIMQINSIAWHITGRDAGEVYHYTQVLQQANNGEGFATFLSRVLLDVLEVPIGGLIEPLRDKSEEVVALYHVDGGTVFPTMKSDKPFIQIDPSNPFRTVQFERGALHRIVWLPMEGLANYYWTRTPVMDCLGPMLSLVRTDQFWSSLISDTPPPGILVLPDFNKEEATDWATSFKTMYEGIDAFKIPIVYEHQSTVQWINFSKNPAELSMEDIAKRYTELVASNFGMSLSEIALYEHAATLAGASRVVQMRKNRGLGSLVAKTTEVMNSILPPSVQFWMEPIDNEDRFRTARVFKLNVDAIKVLIDADILTSEEAKAQLIADGVLRTDEELQAVTTTTENLEDSPTPSKGPESPDAVRAALELPRWVDNTLLDALHTGIELTLSSVRFSSDQSGPKSTPATCSGLQTLIERVYTKGVTAACADIGQDAAGIDNHGYSEIALSRLASKIDKGNALTLKDLHQKVSESLRTTQARSKYDRAALLKAARNVCTSDERVRAIALTEYVTHWNEGYLAVLKQHRMNKLWQAEESACPLCKANQSLGGIGTHGVFMSISGIEIKAPPAHLECVCTLRAQV